MDKENTHKAVLVSHKEERSPVICRKMDSTERHHVKQNKPDTGKKSQMFSLICEKQIKMK